MDILVLLQSQKIRKRRNTRKANLLKKSLLNLRRLLFPQMKVLEKFLVICQVIKRKALLLINLQKRKLLLVFIVSLLNPVTAVNLFSHQRRNKIFKLGQHDPKELSKNQNLGVKMTLINFEKLWKWIQHKLVTTIHPRSQM